MMGTERRWEEEHQEPTRGNTRTVLCLRAGGLSPGMQWECDPPGSGAQVGRGSGGHLQKELG